MAEPTKNAAAPAASQEDIALALDLLKRTREQRAKQREKAKNDPQSAEKAAKRALRLRVKNTILLKKAVDAGIGVTDAEIDTYIAKNKA